MCLCLCRWETEHFINYYENVQKIYAIEITCFNKIKYNEEQKYCNLSSNQICTLCNQIHKVTR